MKRSFGAILFAFAFLVLVLSQAAYARNGHRSSYASGVPRDSHGRIERSESAKHQFEKETGYANGRSGYVVDHIVPLKRGGSDSPSNMEWQTKEAAKQKDKWE